MLSRLQDKTSTFKGPKEVVKQIIRKHGLFGMYAGMESTFWRYVNANSMFDNFLCMSLSDTFTGTEDIPVAFIKWKRYFQNPMSVLSLFFRPEFDLNFIIYCRAHKHNSWIISYLVL